MAKTSSRKPRISVHTEAQRTFIQAPSDQVQAIRQLLQSHGLGSHYPLPVMMGYHSIELGDDVDVGGLRALLDEWTEGR